MAAPRPMSTQGAYLQRETTPGTAATDAMLRFLALRMRPAWDVTTEEFRPEGYKVNTVSQQLESRGRATVEAIQCFNGLTPILASVLGYEGATQPDDVNAPEAWEHTFTLDAKAADLLTTFTYIYGDATLALQMLYTVFNSLTFGVQRGSLTLNTGAIGKAPTTGATIPAEANVTEIPAVPLVATAYDVFVDDDWASAGTTQADAVYEAQVTIGDKRQPAAPIDSRVSGFKALIEGDAVDFSASFRLGFDTDAVSMLGAWQDGAAKVIRMSNTGPVIGGAVNYSLELTASVVIKNPGEIGAAPNAAVVTLPFDAILAPADTGDVLAVKIVNTVPQL